MANRKITREDLQEMIKIVKGSKVRFAMTKQFTPKVEEWIVLWNSAQKNELWTRIIVVGGLENLCKNLADVAVKGASKEVSDYCEKLVELVKKNKAVIFSSEDSCEDLTPFEIIKHCRGKTIKILPFIVENYQGVLKPVKSRDELSQLLEDAGQTWYHAVRENEACLRNFLLQPGGMKIFSGRPLVEAKARFDLVETVMNSRYGIQGGKVLPLLNEVMAEVQETSPLEGWNQLVERLVKMAGEKKLADDSTLFTDEAIQKAKAAPNQLRSPNQGERGAETRLTQENVKQLYAFLKVQNGCNIFLGNIHFSRETQRDINELLQKCGSMKGLIIAMAILHMQGTRVKTFSDLKPLVDSSEVQLFKSKIKDQLQQIIDLASASGEGVGEDDPETVQTEAEIVQRYANEEKEDEKEMEMLKAIDVEKEFPEIPPVEKDPECDDWKTATREKDGKPYFWNVKTEKTQWKRPKCMKKFQADTEAYNKAVQERVEKMEAKRVEVAQSIKSLEEKKSNRKAKLEEEKKKAVVDQAKRRQEASKVEKEKLVINDESVCDILYSGRLRTMAVLPVLQKDWKQNPSVEPEVKRWCGIVETGVKEMFERENKEFKQVYEFLRDQLILIQRDSIRTSQVFRLIRAALYSDYGFNGGSVRTLLDQLHASNKRYQKFVHLIKAVREEADGTAKKKKNEEMRVSIGPDSRRGSEVVMGTIGGDNGQDHILTVGGQGEADDETFVLGPGAKGPVLPGDQHTNLGQPMLTLETGDIDETFTIGPKGPSKASGDEKKMAIGGNDAMVTLKPSTKGDDQVFKIGGTGENSRTDDAATAQQNQKEEKNDGKRLRAMSAQRKTTRMNKRKIKWKKVKELGRGAFGVVIWGIDTRTGQSIAIKQIRLKSKQDIAKAKEVEHEVRTLKTLSHPNIVELYAVERDGYKLNIIMEYVPSNSIDWVVKKIGKLDDHYMARVTAQILQALAYCHLQGLIHRDIKGKNILVDNFGNAKLADFGSALLASDSEMQKENAEYTPLWAAPEMVKGDGKYSTKVDIWSLGCTIVEMASGKEPWSECNFANPFMALYSIGSTDKIPEIPEAMSKDGRDFTLKCLTRDPSKRPNAEELQVHKWVANVLMDEETDDDDDDDMNAFVGKS